MPRKIGSRLSIIVPLAFALGAGVASAQDKYPTKPIRLIVPFPPGFASDFLARTTGQRLAETYTQQIVIDNRPGAGGLIGSRIGARASPDGYTLMMVGQAHLINTLIHKNPDYHPFNDFAAVTQIALMPSVMVIAPNLPVKSLADLIALAKAKPGYYNFGSGGVGAWSHFSGEMFKAAAGIDIVHVPFRLLADWVTEMAAGRVHLYVAPVPAVMPVLKTGKLRPLVATTSKRVIALPDVPTTIEAGLPDYQTDNWFGIGAPAKTPRAIIAQLNRDIVEILAEPGIRERFLAQGAEPASGTPEQFLKLQQDEYARVMKLVKELGIKPG